MKRKKLLTLISAIALITLSSCQTNYYKKNGVYQASVHMYDYIILDNQNVYTAKYLREHTLMFTKRETRIVKEFLVCDYEFFITLEKNDNVMKVYSCVNYLNDENCNYKTLKDYAKSTEWVTTFYKVI